MIISIDTENTFDKIHCPILTKIFNEVEIFKKSLWLEKGPLGKKKKKPTVNIILNGERMLSHQIQNKARIPFLPALFYVVQEVLANAIRQEKKKQKDPD